MHSKVKKSTLFLVFICLCSLQPVYSMTTMKNWVNKIKPGSFETEDASSDTGEYQKETHQYTKAEIQVLTALKKREEELRRREAIHQQKANELKTLAQQIEQKLDQMRKLSAEVETIRKTRKEMDEKDITRMVKYYETMDPEATAVFMNQMDRVTAMHIIMRMNPRKASAIMQLMDPKVAVDITEKVSGFKAGQEELLNK